MSGTKETIVLENQELLKMRKERWAGDLWSSGVTVPTPSPWLVRLLTVSPFSQRRNGSEEDVTAGAQAQE